MAILAGYSFDGSGTAVVDDSGNGHGFTLSNDVVRTAAAGGHTNEGVTRNADNDLAVLADPAFGQSTDRTVMCWIKDPPAGIAWAVRWTVVSIDSGAWGILFLGGGQVCIQARNGSTFARATASFPGGGAWHHYAGTYVESTNTIALYIDGSSADTETLTGPLRTDADTIDIVGWDTTSPIGIIDDLRMFDEALDAAAITALMGVPVAPQTGTLATSIPLQTVALTGEVIQTGTLAVSIPLQTVALTGQVELNLDSPLQAGTVSLAAGRHAGAVQLAAGVHVGTVT